MRNILDSQTDKLYQYNSLSFLRTLDKNKIVNHQHKDLTAADTPISQYSEDIAEVVRNEVIKWMDISNRRGGR